MGLVISEDRLHCLSVRSQGAAVEVDDAEVAGGGPGAKPGAGGQYDKLLRLIDGEGPTLAELLDRPETLASMHWQVIGTVEDARAEITRWFEGGAIDGFVAVPGGAPSSLDLTLGELIPRLAETGHFRSAYSGDTLLHHLQEGLEEAEPAL